MDQTYLQQQAHLRLIAIGERAASITAFVKRCQSLVDRGLAADTEGLPSHEIIAQYADLIGLNVGMMLAQAESLAKQMRAIR